MAKGSLCTALCALALTMTLVPAPSEATEATLRVRSHHVRQVWYHRRLVLPPERHVIEIVKEAYSDRFIINGARFAAKVPACTAGWLAGEPVHFLSGEIHGFCADAVVYNAMRRRACEMWCGGPLFW